MLVLYYFDFWGWVHRQAYPQEFESSDRYDRWSTGRYDQLTMTHTYQGPADLNDRYSR